MLEATVVAPKIKLLRRRFNHFLAGGGKWKIPLRGALHRIIENSWPAVIFGGVLRDLLLLGASEAPRDVDIVVSGVELSDLEQVFADLIQDRNRFGGLRLRPQGWLIDIWALESTWAFREGLKRPPSFDGLVQTTFLNVEAIAAEIATQPRRRRPLYSAGFFEATKAEVLDISLEPNPYPGLCVVRSIMTALRLDWVISRRLGAYIVKQARELPVQRLIDIQESHYGKIRIQQTRMLEYLRAIDEQLQEDSTDPIKLPATRMEQYELSKYWAPVC